MFNHRINNVVNGQTQFLLWMTIVMVFFLIEFWKDVLRSSVLLLLNSSCDSGELLLSLLDLLFSVDVLPGCAGVCSLDYK